MKRDPKETPQTLPATQAGWRRLGRLGTPKKEVPVGGKTTDEDWGCGVPLK